MAMEMETRGLFGRVGSPKRSMYFRGDVGQGATSRGE